MFVYVVHYNHVTGGKVYGVFNSKRKAMNCAKKYALKFNKQVKRDGIKDKDNALIMLECDSEWSNGYEAIQVIPFEVK